MGLMPVPTASPGTSDLSAWGGFSQRSNQIWPLSPWERSRIPSWRDNSELNLGTYNNQYMVLDLKRVKLRYSLGKGTLYVVEQIPTYVEYSEQTDVLRKEFKAIPSYMASSRPAFETLLKKKRRRKIIHCNSAMSTNPASYHVYILF